MNTPRLVISVMACAFATFVSAAYADDAIRDISVSGKATVMVEPDIARINMAVVERNESLSTAQKSVGDVTARVLRLFDELNIDRSRVDTTGNIISPNYRWNRTTEEQELVGYTVERRIMVELRDMDNLGIVIERAVQSGVNQMSAPAFDHSQRDELHRDALAAAVKDARANAEAMAGAAGAEVGEVYSIQSQGSAPPPRPMMRAQMAADSMAESAADSYAPADIRFEARVNIVYELAP